MPEPDFSAPWYLEHLRKTGQTEQQARASANAYLESQGVPSGGGGRSGGAPAPQSSGRPQQEPVPTGPLYSQKPTMSAAPVSSPESQDFGGLLNEIWKTVSKPAVENFKSAADMGGEVKTEQQRQDVLQKYGMSGKVDPTIEGLKSAVQGIGAAAASPLNLMNPLTAPMSLSQIIAQLTQGKTVQQATSQDPGKLFGQAMQQFQAGSELAKRTPNEPGVLGAAQGVTEGIGAGLNTILQTAGAGGTLVERLAGTVSQITGAPLSALTTTNPLSGPNQAVVAAGEAALENSGIAPFVRNAVTNGMTEAAKAVESVPLVGAPLSGAIAALIPNPEDYAGSKTNRTQVVETVAAIRGYEQKLGLPTGDMDNLLVLLAPDEKERAEILQTVDKLQQNMGFGDLRTKFQSSAFAYESTKKMVEAADRLRNGEDWAMVEADLTRSLTVAETGRDLVGQLVLDPLNLPAGDVIGKMTSGMAVTRAQRVLYQVADQGGKLVSEQTGWQKLVGKMGPVGEWLVKESTNSRKIALAQEAADHFTDLMKGIDDPGIALKLQDLGVGETPRLAMLKAMLADGDTYAKAGKETIALEDVKKALGYAARPATVEEIAKMGAQEGTIVDAFNSAAGQNLRTLLKGVKGDDLLTAFGEVEKASNAILDAKGLNALDWQKNYGEALQTFFGKFDNAVRGALEMEKTTGLEKFRTFVSVPQQFMAKLQLAPLNPGFLVRNFGVDTVKLAVGNVNRLASYDGLLREAADFGFGAAQARGITMAEIASGSKTGLMGKFDTLLEKLPTSRLNEATERVSQLAAFIPGYKKGFQAGWRQVTTLDELSKLRTVLPEEHFAALTNKLSRFTGKPGEWKDLLKLVDNPMVRDPKIVQAAVDAGIDLTALERQAGTPEKFMDVAYQQMARAEEAGIATASDGLTGAANRQYEQEALRLIDEIPLEGGEDFVSGITQRTRNRLLEETQNQFREMQFYKNDARNALLQSLDEVKDPAVKQRVTTAMEAIANGVTDGTAAASQQNRVLLSQIKTALADVKTYNIPLPEALAKVGLVDGPWLKLTDAGAVWDAYHLTAKERWLGTWQDAIKAYSDLADSEKLSSSARLAEMATAPTDWIALSDQARSKMLVDLWHNADSAGGYGFKGQRHFENWLRKNNFIPKDALGLRRYHIKNGEWYDNVLKAMEGHATEKASVIAKEVKEADSLAEQAKAGRAALFDMTGTGLSEEEKASNAALYPQYDLVQGQGAKLAYQRQVLMDAMLDAQKNAGTWAKGTQKLTPEVARSLRDFVYDTVRPMHNEARMVARQTGTALQDFHLVNYNKTYNFDTLLAMGFNYPRWHTRNLAWALTMAVRNPGGIAALAKLRNEMRRINADKPTWWQDQVNLTTIGGKHISLPLLASFEPLNALFADKFNDEEMAKTPIGSILQDVQNYGPGLNINVSMIMAAQAMLSNDPQQASVWLNYFGTPTKGFRALTAVAREAGATAIPAGGIAPEGLLESWLMDKDSKGNPFFAGTKYDRQRWGLALTDLVKDGSITQEQAYDIMQNPGGPQFEQVRQRAEMMIADQVLASWLLGAGVRPRNETEMQIVQMDSERRALAANRDNMTTEEWRKGWYDLSQKWTSQGVNPDFVVGFRRDGDQRDTLYGWSVFDRLPPNNTAYFEAAGFDKDVMSILLDEFYSRGGRMGEFTDKDGKKIPAMQGGDREMLMSAFHTLGAVLAFPSTAKADEFNQARATYRAMMATLGQQYGEDVTSLEDGYYQKETKEERTAYLQAHPVLLSYWRSKRDMLTSDPMLTKYYASIDTMQRSLWDGWNADMEKKFPGISQRFEEYNRLKDQGDQIGAKKYFAAHPEMSKYYLEKDLFTLKMEGELDRLSKSIDGLQAGWAEMRADAPKDTPLSQLTVAELIASGSRPMGDFELPENLPAEKLAAQVHIEIESADAAGKYFAVKAELKKMGGLDKVLDAFQQFGNGGTADANTVKVTALLDALASIREKTGYQLLGSSDQVQSAAVLGATTGPRVRSTTYHRPTYSGTRGGGKRKGGGGGKGRKTGPVIEALSAIQSSAPLLWAAFLSMAGMGSDAAGMKQYFLDNPWLMDAIEQAEAQYGFPLERLLAGVDALRN